MSTAYSPKQIIKSGNAGLNHTSTDNADSACLGRSCDLELHNIASIQLIWSGLTGTLDGVLNVEVSNDNVNWVQKVASGISASITISTAAGSDTFALDTVVERYYRAKWIANGVTGGLVTCILNAKGSWEPVSSIDINNKMPSLTGRQSVSQWLKPLLKLHITNANTQSKAVQYSHGVTTVTNAYFGGVYSPSQNRIYLIPNAQSNQTNWHYIDCTSGLTVAYAKVITAVAGAYSGGVYHPVLNRIYLVPSGQADPTNDNWHYIDCNTGLAVAYAHGLGAGFKTVTGAYIGGVFDPTKSRIYFIPYAQSGDANWHYIDSAGVVVSYAHGQSATLTANAYGSGAYSPTQNRIYLTPRGQGAPANLSWHYIDCTLGTVVPYVHGVTTVADAYTAASYSPTQNRIYFSPYAQGNVATWHYIDCNTGVVTPYTHLMTVVANGYKGAVYSPSNNRIYFVPYDQCAETTWHYIDCNTGLAVPYVHGVTGLISGYRGGCFSPRQNRIHFIPYNFGNPTYTKWHYIHMTNEKVGINQHQFGSTIFSSTL